jgi:Phosphoenolpyruvate-protein kinase (PTS system EI component in bacteria)
LFLSRTHAPSEDEQAAVYESIAKALEPKQTLIIRTLDVGGDKPLPYLPIPKEDNPFLGERGIRVCINNPEVLRSQLRAVLRAAKVTGNISVMFPMIANLSELRFAKKYLKKKR